VWNRNKKNRKNSHVARRNVHDYEEPRQIYASSLYCEAEPYMFKTGRDGGCPTCNVNVLQKTRSLLLYIFCLVSVYRIHKSNTKECTNVFRTYCHSVRLTGTTVPEEMAASTFRVKMHAAGYTQTSTPVDLHGLRATNTVNLHFQLRENIKPHILPWTSR
jgi:hypothetical protein